MPPIHARCETRDERNRIQGRGGEGRGKHTVARRVNSSPKNPKTTAKEDVRSVNSNSRATTFLFGQLSANSRRPCACFVHQPNPHITSSTFVGASYTGEDGAWRLDRHDVTPGRKNITTPTPHFSNLTYISLQVPKWGTDHLLDYPVDLCSLHVSFGSKGHHHTLAQPCSDQASAALYNTMLLILNLSLSSSDPPAFTRTA